MFSQQLQALRRRTVALYQASTNTSAADLLPQAFDELQSAIDQLQSAEDLLVRSQRELDAARSSQEQDRQHAFDTFNRVPIAYMITSLDGTIKRSNAAAANLLNQNERHLLGKSLSLFIPDGERRSFRSQLVRLQSLTQPAQLNLRFQPANTRPAQCTVVVGTTSDSTGRVIALHWLIRQYVAELEESISFSNAF